VIVCSCNVLSDAQVKSAVAGAASRPRMSRVYSSLGCAARCGRCAHTIKALLEQIGHCATADRRTVEAIQAN
jgi:bacterioferritin-associated ferredoxin